MTSPREAALAAVISKALDAWIDAWIDDPHADLDQSPYVAKAILAADLIQPEEDKSELEADLKIKSDILAQIHASVAKLDYVNISPHVEAGENLIDGAATYIELLHGDNAALRAQLSTLRGRVAEAVGPFVKALNRLARLSSESERWSDAEQIEISVTLGDLRRLASLIDAELP